MSNSNRTPEKAVAFCAALAETCNIGKACKAVGMGRTTAYEWRDSDEAFAEMWDKAMKVGVSVLEDEATRRAHEGVDKPVVHKGEFTYLRDFAAIDPKTGERYEPDEAPIKLDAAGNPCIATVKEYSDTLMIFLLKAHDPEKYRENSKIELAGHLAVTEMTDDEIRAELATYAATFLGQGPTDGEG